MGTLQVSCRFCGYVFVAVDVNRSRMDDVLAELYRLGWTGSLQHGGWLCSDDCRAWSAKDVTPVLRPLGRF